VNDSIEKYFNEAYAYGQLTEFVHKIFVGLVPAREKLSENLHFLATISPSDFKTEKHQKLWKEMQDKLIGKTKNIWLERAPIDRLRVRNKTLEFALESIWSVYEDCSNKHF
jgi:hypothetical protein